MKLNTFLMKYMKALENIGKRNVEELVENLSFVVDCEVCPFERSCPKGERAQCNCENYLKNNIEV